MNNDLVSFIFPFLPPGNGEIKPDVLVFLLFDQWELLIEPSVTVYLPGFGFRLNKNRLAKQGCRLKKYRQVNQVFLILSLEIVDSTNTY